MKTSQCHFFSYIPPSLFSTKPRAGRKDWPLDHGLPLALALPSGEPDDLGLDLGSPLPHVVLNVKDERVLAEVSVHNLPRCLQPHRGVEVGLGRGLKHGKYESWGGSSTGMLWLVWAAKNVLLNHREWLQGAMLWTTSPLLYFPLSPFTQFGKENTMTYIVGCGHMNKIS